MSVQHNATTESVESIALSDLELPFDASPIMDYHTPAKRLVGTTLIVGYLSDDSDCQNPLEDCDGMGKIHSAHRHSRNHSEMQEALALDSDWEPDLDLVDDFTSRLRRPWIEAAMQSAEFIEWANESAGPTARKDDAYYKRRAAKLWRETDGEYCYGASDIYDFDFTDSVREQVWQELRSEGLIGDRDAVVLDCYEHGGQVWSITGQGMQCRWDTSTGAGVWIPDQCAKEEIERRAAVYAYGEVKDNGSWTRGSGRKRFYAEVDGRWGGEMSPQFKHWHEAFDWLSNQAESLKLPRRKLERESVLEAGRRRAAVELAESALESYNQWLAGSTFGIVSASYENIGTAEEPEWSFVDSDECWGFIGDDFAMEQVTDEVNAKADNLQPKAA
tara:strand:+ start:4154 stop:5317 length:1164 start_codon:yes stop_codon:yes gene_type:complete